MTRLYAGPGWVRFWKPHISECRVAETMQGKASYGGYVTWDDHPARVAAAHKVHIFFCVSRASIHWQFTQEYYCMYARLFCAWASPSLPLEIICNARYVLLNFFGAVAMESDVFLDCQVFVMLCFRVLTVRAHIRSFLLHPPLSLHVFPPFSLGTLLLSFFPLQKSNATSKTLNGCQPFGCANGIE